MVWQIAIIKIGHVYPKIKSIGFIGEAYSLVKKALVLSFEIRIHVNSITNVYPNIATAGDKDFNLNISIFASLGIPLSTIVIIISIIIGKPKQKI